MEDFSMDWSNPMAMFTSSGPPDVVDDGDDEDDDHDDEEEMMDEHNGHDVDDDTNDNSKSGRRDGHTAAGAVQHNTQPLVTPAPTVQPPLGDAEKRLENQRRAEMLRAKLLASRQNTPVKAATPVKSAPAVDTPTKAPAKETAIATKGALAPKTSSPSQHNGNMQNTRGDSTADLDVEALLTAGKAQADAQIAAAAKTQPSSPVQKAPASVTNGTTRRRHAKDKDLITGEPVSHQQNHPLTSSTLPAQRPTNLADSYYTDLAAWLDLTGYHDVDYRTSKLRTYKERRALEEEAARIAEKLEKLRQAEQAEMQQLRIGTPAVKAPNMAPPPLPHSIDVPQQLHGIKRGRSPEPHPGEKRQREDNGFRIRGVKGSPDGRPPAYRPGRSPSPGYDRRISYSDARRRSSIEDRGSSDIRSRDPSLERRTQYYRRDDEYPRYDHYTPRESVSREPRLNYGATNVPRSGRPGGRDVAPSYRPSAGLELKKGGIRYFMIKSWNLKNVQEAQRTNIWATQEKNTEVLTHAFHTARHVILLFSVNKSMAFQGYALMTSAPDDRKFPPPSFASQLNWATSPPFTLRWLAQTPIHFKLVGHLKNTLNYDEQRGESHAVLVGKDGQEISADAGMNVVWILDEAEVEEEGGVKKK